MGGCYIYVYSLILWGFLSHIYLHDIWLVDNYSYHVLLSYISHILRLGYQKITSSKSLGSQDLFQCCNFHVWNKNFLQHLDIFIMGFRTLF